MLVKIIWFRTGFKTPRPLNMYVFCDISGVWGQPKVLDANWMDVQVKHVIFDKIPQKVPYFFRKINTY